MDVETPPEKVRCPRFKMATHMLEKPHDVSVDFVRGILAAVSNEDKAATQYSYICDLKKGVVYVYHFHNFENVRVFNLSEELEKGGAKYDIPDLFPTTFAFEMFKSNRDREMKEEVEKRLDKSFDATLLAGKGTLA